MDFQQAGEAKVAIIGLPYDANSSYLRGAAEAPPLIRQAFHCDSTNKWSESGLDLGLPTTVFDGGDCIIGSDFTTDIELCIGSALERKLTPILLGGDHSITYPVLKAFHRRFPCLSILHFDAHPDLYHDFHGNPYSHASPFARIMEERLAQRLVQVGIRTMNAHQRRQAEKFGVEVVEMKDWRDDILLEFGTPIYISIDMDALDPAFAPGVSHPEPGGLSTRQIIKVIQQIKSEVVGADIVEFNPRRDTVGITAMACAKLLKELAAKMISSRR